MSNSLPPPPTSPTEKRNGLLTWASAHKVWTAIIIVIVIAVIASAANNDPAKKAAGTTSTDTTISDPPAVMPDVVGKDGKKATTALEQAGLNVTVTKDYSNEPTGTVLRSSEDEGAELEEGTTVTLVIAKPIPKVPNVVGLTQEAATSKLKHAGYKVVVKKQESSATAGRVLSSSPRAGSPRLPDKPVTIVVAKPPPPPVDNCTPGYSPCLPAGPSDYDCYGGSGNGPAYTKPGVTYSVAPSDPYGLDSDGDGYGCE